MYVMNKACGNIIASATTACKTFRSLASSLLTLDKRTAEEVDYTAYHKMVVTSNAKCHFK